MTINTQKLRERAGKLTPPHLDIAMLLLGAADAFDTQTAEIARLREALLWNAAALQESCRATVPITEGDLFFVGADARTAAEILNAADAALAQEGS